MNTSLTDKQPGAQLDTTVALSGNHLQLDYRLHNAGKKPIYVFNKLYNRITSDGIWHVAPDLVYVTLIQGTVALSKKTFPVPDDMDVEYRRVPCVSNVRPGASLREQFSLHLPLAVWDAYHPQAKGPCQTEQAEFTWEVGYFVEQPGTDKLASEVKTPNGMALHFSTFSAASQLILKTGPFPFKVSVQVARP